jgi:hypothetical protein
MFDNHGESECSRVTTKHYAPDRPNLQHFLLQKSTVDLRINPIHLPDAKLSDTLQNHSKPQKTSRNTDES